MGRHTAARRIWVLFVPPLLGAVLAGVASPAPAATAAGWARPASRLASVGEDGILLGVAATSARSAWAVGQTGSLVSSKAATLIERWNSTRWRIVPSPNPAPGGTVVYGVAVTSARSAWAVGCVACLRAEPRTLILHWNGTAWKRVRSPSPPNGGTLFGVAVTSARRAWAVGQTGGSISTRPRTLILRWNGAVWRRVPSPNAATPGSSLGAVAVASGGGAWAVGCACNGPALKPLIERWNGTRWRIVPSPNPAPGGTVLYGVAVTSARSAWAVGCVACLRAEPRTLILHWNGTAWKRVRSPNPASGGTLFGVAVTSASNAWAVGFTGVPGISRPKTVIERWNGIAWKRVPSPNPTSTAALFSVAAASARSAWAVGATGRLGGAKPKTVALRWNGATWQ